MTAYRVRLTSLDLAAREDRVVDCADDDDAIHYAADITHSGDIDIWEARRHVAHFHEIAGAVSYFRAPG